MINADAKSAESIASFSQKRLLHRAVLEMTLAHRHGDADRVAKILAAQAILELQVPKVQFSGKHDVSVYLTQKFVQCQFKLGGSQLSKLVPGRIDTPNGGALLCCIAYNMEGRIAEVWVPELGLDSLVSKVTVICDSHFLSTAIPYAL